MLIADLTVQDGSGALAAAVNASDHSRGGAARGSPESTVHDAPGVKLGRAWVWRDQRDTRDPPGTLAGLGGARGCGCDGGGGSGRWHSPACARSGCSGLGTVVNRGSVRARC
jgi:hypothetical protein